MRTEEFDYSLPKDLIAQHPAARRDGSRLLVLHRSSGLVEHRHFSDLPEYLQTGDVVVVNDSKVIPARLFGQRSAGGGRIEILLLRHIASDRWLALARPGRRVRQGDRLTFDGGRLTGIIEQVQEEGMRVIAFSSADGPVGSILERIGEMPLPPYIYERASEPGRYQTVYAREIGSVAAPTAGLHFTEDLLDRVRSKGVEVRAVTLHVGLGTFRPVSVDKVEDHRMHAEFGLLPPETAEAINAARAASKRVIAVGTTVVRVLEAAALAGPGPWTGWTDIFIRPGFAFQRVDALVTNFHLPRSSLLMLVSAFAGRERVLDCYRVAVGERYRFFSFGDAMLIV